MEKASPFLHHPIPSALMKEAFIREKLLTIIRM
jgi:hypothetical protein